MNRPRTRNLDPLQFAAQDAVEMPENCRDCLLKGVCDWVPVPGANLPCEKKIRPRDFPDPPGRESISPKGRAYLAAVRAGLVVRADDSGDYPLDAFNRFWDQLALISATAGNQEQNRAQGWGWLDTTVAVAVSLAVSLACQLIFFLG